MLKAIIILEPLNKSQIAFGGNNFCFSETNNFVELLLFFWSCLGIGKKTHFIYEGLGGGILSVNVSKYLFSNNLITYQKLKFNNNSPYKIFLTIGNQVFKES